MKTTKRFARLLAGITPLAALLVASTANAASDSWTGGTDGTWATSGNWLGGNIPGTGDTATFNASSANTTVDLGGGVTISNVLFDTASASPYTIGSGAVGSQTLTLNSTLGGVALSSTVTANQTLNANLAYATTGIYNIANDSANRLTLAGTNSASSAGIKVMRVGGSGNTTISGPTISGTGSMNLEKTNSGTLTLSGGARWDGNGVNAYLPGSTPVPAVIRAGNVVMQSGAYTNNGEFVIGGVIANGGAGNNAKLTLLGTSTVGVSSWFSLGRGNGVGGVSTDLVLSNNATVYAGNLSAGFNANTANLPKGSVTLNDNSLFTIMGNGAVNFAESLGSDMTMNLNNSAQFIAIGTGVKSLGQNGKGVINIKDTSSMTLGNATTYIGREYGTGIVTVANSGKLNIAGELRLAGSDVSGAGRNAFGLLTVDGGTVNLSSFTFGRGNDVNNQPHGNLVITNGGIVNVTNDSFLGFAGAAGSYGKITVNNGGKFKFGVTGARWLFAGQWDYCDGIIEVNNGGELQLLFQSAIKMTRASTASNLDHTNHIDINGGALTSYTDGGTNVAGAGSNIDMQQNTGSLPLAKNIINLNGGVLTIGDIRSSGTSSTRVINFNGGTLRAAANDGRALVTISGATARLNVRDGGAIIDTFGNNTYIASTQLQHSDIAGDAATDGGFTKLGGGTFTLTNGYSYTGPTRVLGGTLVMSTAAGVGSSGGELVVSNATLTLNASSGTPVPAADVKLGPQATLNITTPIYGASVNGTGNVIFGTNTTLNLNYGVVSGNPTVAAITVAGGFTAPGTAGTNILINISATGLDTGAGVPIPLIVSTGTATTNGFVLGTLPPGIKAVLTNNTPGSLDLLITSAAKNLSWHGVNGDNTVAMTNWNFNDASNTNWFDPANNPAKYSEYPADNLGDNVTFGSAAFNFDGTNHVNVTTNVVPATATFSAIAPFELSGPGGIGGATALVFTNNSAAVYLYTTNTYTGGTVLASGTLVITNDAALGSSGVNLAGGTLRTEANVTSSRAVTVTANSTLSAPAGTTLTMNGTVSGTAAVTKADDGALTLAGNSRYGATRIDAGTVSLTGAVTNNSTTVGSASGNAVMNLSGSLVSSNLFVGNVSGAAAAVYQTAGSVKVAGSGDSLNLGNLDGTYGYYSAAGGTLNIKGISIGGGANTTTGQPWPPAGNNAYGLMEVNGATINNDSGWIVLARGGQNNIGVLNMISGSLTYGDGGIGCNWQTVVDGTQTSIINVMGGLLSTTNTPVDFRTANTGILNLNGGVLQTVNVTGYGDINFNGGTVRAVANNGTFLNVNSNIYIYSGGAKIDDNGKTITIAHALLGATNNGLSGINIDNNGSGYIAPPILTISGDGRGASAIAQIDRTAGTVTNVIITCPGDGYTYASVNVTGGGGSGASFSVPGYAANTSGGLTKTGNGTLSLSGANTYSGATVVAQGTLSLTPVYQHTNSTVVLSNGAFLTISATGNAITRVGGLTIGGVATDSAEIAFQLPTGTNPVAALLECNALTLNGTNSIRVSGLLTAGTFPVLKYSSITGASLLNPALRVPHGYSGVVSNDNATKTIYVTLSGAGGIVWQGYNPDLALTNVWDFTTTNWLTGIDLTSYIEGDKVVFNDTGSGLVLLSNTVSPGGMVITNNSVSYTMQGSGIVSGVGGLTKIGSGSATVNFAANNFTGPTIVSNGSLTIAGGGAIGDSSAVTLKDVAGASLTVSSSETIGSLAGGGATGGNVSLSGTLTAGGDNSSTAYGGTISGSGGLTKTGNGALSLSGAYSAGDVSVPSGSLNLTGSSSMTAPRMYVAASSGTTGTVAMVTGSALTNNYVNTGSWWINYALALGVDNGHTGNFNMSGGTVNETGSVWVGSWGGTGNWIQTGGTANISSHFWVGAMQDNNTSQPNGSIGTAIISNATVSATFVAVGLGGAGGGDNPTAVAASRTRGTLTVANGGVVNSENDLQVGRSGEGSSGWGSYGTLNIENGGIVNVATATTRWMTMGRYNSIDATVNIKSGGTLNLNAGTDLIINEGNNTGIRVVNVAGLLQGTAAGGSYINLNQNATAGGTTTLNITNGGVVAVDAIVGQANCTLNFASGTLKATASDANFIGAGFTANILPGGAILDTAGFNPTVAGNLLNNGVNEDGGLTKNGNGTLYLNGVNTYTNVTTVNAGKLGGTGTIAGRLVVNSTAGLAPGNSGVGALTVTGNITLNAGSTNVFAVDGTTPANDSVVAGAGVTYGGVLRVASTGTLTAGQEFQLFSGAGATNPGNFASVQAVDPAAVFSFTNGVLKVVSYSSINTNAPQLQVSVSGNQLTLGWPTNAGWILQSNSVSLANSSAWFNYPANGAVDVTNIVITMDPAKTNVFYRMLKP